MFFATVSRKQIELYISEKSDYDETIQKGGADRLKSGELSGAPGRRQRHIRSGAPNNPQANHREKG
ncbi:hypothetical protein A7X67_13395 [Clostridium sp. W14A]|nr:hypothetical protein A7X67_13395 [Clostridium sp. W14A]